MNKALQILTEHRDALKAEAQWLEFLLLKEDVQCNIDSFTRMLGKLKGWISDIEKGIEKLSE